MFTDDCVNVWLEKFATSWISLHYDDPGLDGAGLSEISGGSYVRIKTEFTQPTNRAIWSITDTRFAGLPATQVTHVGVWLVQRGGLLQAYVALPKRVIVPAGKGLILAAGELALSVG